MFPEGRKKGEGRKEVSVARNIATTVAECAGQCALSSAKTRPGKVYKNSKNDPNKIQNMCRAIRKCFNEQKAVKQMEKIKYFKRKGCSKMSRKR